MKNYSHILTFKGHSSGIGKTDKIKSEVMKTNKEYKRIPIYGELNRENLIALHKKKLYSKCSEIDLTPIAQNIGLHYDVYPTSREDINVIMFELLFLKSLSDYHCNKFYIPENTSIYIEISFSLNQSLPPLFNLFSKIELSWNFGNIRVGSQVDDKYQKVCRYLNALREYAKKPESYDIKTLKMDPKIMSTQECLALLNSYLVTRLKSPNFYYINSFVCFVFDQLMRLENSTFMSHENLAIQMPSSFFGPKREKLARDLHHDIVNHLFELALKISIVDKYQETNL